MPVITGVSTDVLSFAGTGVSLNTGWLPTGVLPIEVSAPTSLADEPPVASGASATSLAAPAASSPFAAGTAALSLGAVSDGMVVVAVSA